MKPAGHDPHRISSEQWIHVYDEIAPELTANKKFN